MFSQAKPKSRPISISRLLQLLILQIVGEAFLASLSICGYALWNGIRYLPTDPIFWISTIGVLMTLASLAVLILRKPFRKGDYTEVDYTVIVTLLLGILGSFTIFLR